MTPPRPAGPTPTLHELAAEVAALRVRVAQLEWATGRPADATLIDLSPQDAIALLGGAADRLAQMQADATRDT